MLDIEIPINYHNLIIKYGYKASIFDTTITYRKMLYFLNYKYGVKITNDKSSHTLKILCRINSQIYSMQMNYNGFTPELLEMNCLRIFLDKVFEMLSNPIPTINNITFD